MLKLSLVVVSTFLFCHILHATGIFTAITTLKNTYWTPPGCVACFKSIDEGFFQDLFAIKPDCVSKMQTKMEEFQSLGTTSYLLNVCRDSDEEDFKDRMKTLEKKAKEVLDSFTKCVKNNLEYPQKDAIRELREEFQKRRKECGDKNHMERELKSFWKNLPEVGIFELALQLQQSSLGQSSETPRNYT